MTITPFDRLLDAARRQHEPQRLLFVFVSAELPEDATEAERRRFEENAGGSLKPVLCVDKLPEELSGFAALREESERTGVAWDLLFAAALPGQAGITPGADEAEQPLKIMVGAIETGNVGRFLAFDRAGQPVEFY
ncbi:ribonucleotide reductase subunit alpha [Stutzerimonas stutzeri]|uniref:Ribonucleotide reductase subunit alpha n=1 Tax=Stutzerimonas stutzeri TaxID=316 RepID=A0A2N8T491_STUST|nr:ribonucleotide reductase subunit alpha [Stutzerimonas stutzeri]MCQ4327639.1 ribonucleotide reductase subunit alpha [Stutzerimonas stutzeri]PNG09577.1 ribonucleotide reductase subunit alpha [Stutzerimonas stutzeri]